MTAFGVLTVIADSVQYQEAIFWGVLLQDQWGRSPTLTARSEGVIDGAPLPIGPAWCARSEDGLVADRTRASVNHFLYTVELPSPDGAVAEPRRTLVDMVTVFKDP
jgi:hypothetical protein